VATRQVAQAEDDEGTVEVCLLLGAVLVKGCPQKKFFVCDAINGTLTERVGNATVKKNA